MKCVAISAFEIVRVSDAEAERLVAQGGRYVSQSAYRNYRKSRLEDWAAQMVLESVRRGQESHFDYNEDWQPDSPEEARNDPLEAYYETEGAVQEEQLGEFYRQMQREVGRGR